MRSSAPFARTGSQERLSVRCALARLTTGARLTHDNCLLPVRRLGGRAACRLQKLQGPLDDWQECHLHAACVRSRLAMLYYPSGLTSSHHRTLQRLVNRGDDGRVVRCRCYQHAEVSRRGRTLRPDPLERGVTSGSNIVRTSTRWLRARVREGRWGWGGGVIMMRRS